MEVDSKKILEIQSKILSWYEINKRELPWRNTHNPYYIHLSEIMLQQTQVKRVIEYYNKFTMFYPSLEDMAQAPKSDLLSHWIGLGYNNRILRLQKSAQSILENYEGKYPKDQKELQKLPGVGIYTSGAILAFAFNIESIVVDTNIRRILIYEFNLDENISQKELEELAEKITPKEKAREWNNALMDYGSMEITAKKSKIKSKGKQSKFVGSTRWVRSNILKKLLNEKKLSIRDLSVEYETYDIDLILEKMQKDELIVIQGDQIVLAN